MSRSLTFARTLAAELRGAAVSPSRGLGYFVTGRLDTSVVIVPVRIGVPWLFRDLKRHPPLAQCLAHWMKVGADWHNAQTMCWVIPDEWRDAMAWRGKAVRVIMDEGREWFFNNVRCLINRHYSAHCDGLTTWPKEWPFWSHAGEGVQEYRREERSRRKQYPTGDRTSSGRRLVSNLSRALDSIAE